MNKSEQFFESRESAKFGFDNEWNYIKVILNKILFEIMVEKIHKKVTGTKWDEEI